MRSPETQTLATSLECQLCQKTFSQKSCLVRHRKLCSREKPISARQKSCKQCSIAKTKCDLGRPCCSRCTLRGVSCYYTVGPQIDVPAAENNTERANRRSSFVVGATESLLNSVLGLDGPIDSLPQEFEEAVNIASASGSVLGSSECTESTRPTSANSPNVSWIGDQWMLSVLPTADTTPPLTKHSMQTLLRVLRTWPSMIARGFQLPPIFHNSVDPLKNLPQPLANCFTLVKMWAGQFEGANSIVRDTILKEMRTLFEAFQTYDEINLLAALQALIIYTIVLTFPSRQQNAIPALDPSIFTNLQQVVYYSASTGLVLHQEADVIPAWESWTHITSKNRAVLTLYLLHWSYSVYHHIPSFNCDELGFLPAPAAKFLWQASSRDQWETLYKRWLSQWEGREYLQGEFNDVKPGVILDPRTQMWLEDADELGILFLSILNATDREPQFIQHQLSAKG